ncbi:AAA family ATPase [Desulfoferula mesophila]|uniref:Transporter n=1 Tax=Desulfoferula mesophila TaxID=3058419 RepID=A0AAU9ENY4_9BACT|nr:transporter [Desulfoferula mesophilus]
MAIITISRGSNSKGKEVAEKVAQALGYQCFSRELLLEASEQFNIPEIKLVRALHDAPSILERLTYGKERYLAYITAAFLEHVHQDNVVYHGLAGQFLLRGVSHVLKVRIVADMQARAALEMEREHIGREEALARLSKDDHERRQWSLKLHQVDIWDPLLYDLVLHIHKLTVDDVADIIRHTAQLEQFQATPQSHQFLHNLLLAAQVKAALVHDYPMVKVSACDGVVSVEAKFNQSQEPLLGEEIKQKAMQVPGVKAVNMHAQQTTAYVCGAQQE